MKSYVTELELEFDPFAPDAVGAGFYAGGKRRMLVEQILQLVLESHMLAVVSAAKGSGKTTLAEEIRHTLGDDAVCIWVSATVFMNAAQFLDAVGKQLPKHRHIAAIPDVAAGIKRLQQFAAELDLEAQPLLLIVDDASELGADVLELLAELVAGVPRSCVRAVVLGEASLPGLLQSALPAASQAHHSEFELPAFSAEDTVEYIRFKLANAGLQSALPLGDDAVVAIHNAAKGLPGCIDSLTAEALEAGEHAVMAEPEPAPARKVRDKRLHFDAKDHMQFDLDMVDLDDEIETAPEFPDVDDSEPGVASSRDAAQAQLYDYARQYRYQIAASLLVVVLLVTMFAWNTEPSNVPADIAQSASTVATNGGSVSPGPTAAGSVNRIQLAPPVRRDTTADTQEQPNPADARPATATPERDAVPVASAPTPQPSLPRDATPSRVVASSAAPVKTGQDSSAAATPVVADKPATAASGADNLTGFEKELMSYAASSYTIQILGSHSEANVQKFIADKPVSENQGYYETRHQNKPWFVVVAGNFSDRSSANAVINRLPPDLRTMQPWIRTVADVQRDIRQFHR